jgi:hypothetical protein
MAPPAPQQLANGTFVPKEPLLRRAISFCTILFQVDFLPQCNRNEVGEDPGAPRPMDAIALKGKPAGREPAPSPLIVRMHPGATKPFSVADEAALKQRRPTLPVDQTTGFDRVSPTPQRDLPPIPQCRPMHGEPGSKAMAEVVTVLCVFFSVSIFLAHAVEAFRAR